MRSKSAYIYTIGLTVEELLCAVVKLVEVFGLILLASSIVVVVVFVLVIVVAIARRRCLSNHVWRPNRTVNRLLDWKLKYH